MKYKILSFIILLSNFIAAQSTTTTPPDFTSKYYDAVAGGLILILIISAAAFLFFGTEEKEVKVKVKKESVIIKFFKRINGALTGAVPIEKENEIVMADDYDGIRELDNRVPPWFSYLFYVTIIFAVIYLFNFHVFDGKLQEQEYADEMVVAENLRAELLKSGALINEETVTFVNDPAVIESGKTIFSTYCISCHAPDGGGLIGPNLTDDYWINGGGIKNIYRVISNGVLAKGMLSWKQQLNPKQIQDVASFVISLKGTKPANAKLPQGTLYVEADSTKDLSMR